MPCDNLPQNGAALAAVLRTAAESVDPSLARWMEQQVSVATTMVDRITPEPTDADRATVLAMTGVDDRCPVATEPFSEWVIAGEFPGGRPAWETAGAVLTPDVTPFEDRKLWLLNGGALAARLRGLGCGASGPSARPSADPLCRAWVEQWWDTCAPHLDLPDDDVARYRAALLERFAHPRIRHSLEQIAADGSQKLPARILPVLRSERAAGRVPEAAARVLAAWVLHLGGTGGAGEGRASRRTAPAARGRPARRGAARCWRRWTLPSADDAELVAAVTACIAELHPR